MSATGIKSMVTVIIPCFNGGRWLREAIDSALAQTWDPIEVIVVDDGSTDDSVEIARSYGSSVKSLVFANGGPSVARNRGIAEARGEFIQFLDADDLLLPQKVEACVRAIRGPNDVSFTMARSIYSVKPTAKARVGDAFKRLLRRSAPKMRLDRPIINALTYEIQTHQWLHRTAILRALGGFNERMRWLEDIELNLRVAVSGAQLRAVDSELVVLRHHNSPSRQRLNPLAVTASLEYERDMLALVQRELGSLDPEVERVFADRLAHTARRAWRAGHIDDARGQFQAARSLHPKPRSTSIPIYNAISSCLGMERFEGLLDRLQTGSVREPTR